MILDQAIQQVRLAVDDLNAQLVTDSEIIFFLSEGAKRMCTKAQMITVPYQITATVGQQEYVLPRDCDELVMVRWFQGTLLSLMPVDEARAKFGNLVQGTPSKFYIRYGTRAFAPQIAGGNISVTNIPQGVSTKPEFVIGLWPVPNSANALTIFYLARHPDLNLRSDEPMIPEEFQRGWLCYAIAKCKEKEYAYPEADRYMQEFDRQTTEAKEKFDNMGQEAALPRINIRRTDKQSPFEGSSWIYVGPATYQ